MVQTGASISKFLFQNMYRHRRLIRIRERAGSTHPRSFSEVLGGARMRCRPNGRLAAAKAGADEARRARLVCDYIAGMTDLYALAEHRRLFDKTPELRLSAPETHVAD